MDVHGSRKVCVEQARWAEGVRGAVRAELSAMAPTELTKRAGAAGVSEEVLEGANSGIDRTRPQAAADYKEAAIIAVGRKVIKRRSQSKRAQGYIRL